MEHTSGSHISLLIKVALPAGILLATTIAGASWRQSISNEHRLTANEEAAQFLSKSVDATLSRQLMVEQKFDALLAGVGRIEGALAERNRTEAVVVPKPLKHKE